MSLPQTPRPFAQGVLAMSKSSPAMRDVVLPGDDSSTPTKVSSNWAFFEAMDKELISPNDIMKYFQSGNHSSAPWPFASVVLRPEHHMQVGYLKAPMFNHALADKNVKVANWPKDPEHSKALTAYFVKEYGMKDDDNAYPRPPTHASHFRRTLACKNDCTDTY